MTSLVFSRGGRRRGWPEAAPTREQRRRRPKAAPTCRYWKRSGGEVAGEDDVGGVPEFGGNGAAGLGGYDNFEGVGVSGELVQQVGPRGRRYRLEERQVAEDGEDLLRGRRGGRGELGAAKVERGVACVQRT